MTQTPDALPGPPQAAPGAASAGARGYPAARAARLRAKAWLLLILPFGLTTWAAFPYIGPFYPFPKVPLGYRAVKLEWEDGHWWYGRTQTKKDYWLVRYW